MKTITAKTKRAEAAKAAAGTTTTSTTATTPATPNKTVKEATPAELRRAAASLRLMGDEPAAIKLEAKAGEMTPVRTKAEPKEPRPTCTGTKKNGDPCTAKAKEGQVTCVDHTPAWDRLETLEQGLFTTWYKQQTVADIANLLGWHQAKLIAHNEAR